MPAFSPIRFYHELRRRRMIKVTLIYLAGAWAVIGACDLLLPQLVVDVEAAMRIVFALAIVQLPVALVFGWLYDITDQGIQRTAELSGSSSSPDTTLNRRDHLLIGTLSTAVIAILATGAFSISQLPRVIPAPPENSIAVLPFEICTDQDLDIRLAPALAMEVINHLAGRPQLKVIARQSSFTMAGFGLSLPEIAEPLGVRYLLKGELCRDGETRTLSVTLFDEDGTNVWAQRYQQQTDASERITQTLPSLVADGVAMQLGGVSAIKAVEPVDREAYEQLLIGREHRWQGNHDEARAALERALEIQPDYAEAVFEMALMERKHGGLSVKAGSGLKEAKNVAEHSLTLARRQLERDPRSANSHFVAGDILDALAHWEANLIWRESGDQSEKEVAARKQALKVRYQEAEQHFRAAIALNPSRTELYFSLASVIEGQGPARDTEALGIYEQGQIRDPFNRLLNGYIAKRWAGRGRYREAIELLERFKSLPEIPPGAWWMQLELMQLQTYWDEKCETLIEMLLHDPEAFRKRSDNRWQAWWFVSDLAWLGLYEEAEAWKARIENMNMAEWMHKWGYWHYLQATGRVHEVIQQILERFADMSDEDVLNAFHYWGAGFAFALADIGEHERAVTLMESIQHAPDIWAEREIDPLMGLAILYQKVGRDHDARPLLEEISARLEAEYASGIRHPDTLATLAEVYARQKRDDEALVMLRKAVDYHYLMPCQVLLGGDATGFPWWRFKNDPRMVTICQRIDADLEQQGNRVRAMLAEHDVDELLAPLMAFVEETAIETRE